MAFAAVSQRIEVSGEMPQLAVRLDQTVHPLALPFAHSITCRFRLFLILFFGAPVAELEAPEKGRPFVAERTGIALVLLVKLVDVFRVGTVGIERRHGHCPALELYVQWKHYFHDGLH